MTIIGLSLAKKINLTFITTSLINHNVSPPLSRSTFQMIKYQSVKIELIAGVQENGLVIKLMHFLCLPAMAVLSSKLFYFCFLFHFVVFQFYFILGGCRLLKFFKDTCTIISELSFSNFW